MQIELQSLQREVGITFVLVTHDQEEALSMSDTVAIMREGRVVQFGPPAELYDAPRNRYVADFVGESNLFAGEVTSAQGSDVVVRLDNGIALAARSATVIGLAAGGRATVVVRPEAVRLWPAADTGPEGLDHRFEGRIENRIYLGEATEVALTSAALGRMLARVPKSAVAATLAPGTTVGFGWRRDDALALAEG
jgi:spermidine/putrescine transport system ATP-binding protein